MLSNISKFSWAEMFSNDNGKTSATAFSGWLICVIGSICFLLGCIDKMWVSNSVDIITQSIVFVTIGAALLGIRKVATNKTTSTPTQETLTQEPPIEQINS